jgi:hypothetical protein
MALAQVAEPAAAPGVTVTGVTVAVTNVPVPATAPVETLTNQPAIAHPPAAATGVTHSASVSNQVAIPAFPTTDEPETVFERTGYGFFTYQSTGSHFKAGVRSLNISLKETQRGSKVGSKYVDTYMGSIMEIEEDSDGGLNRVFLQVRPLPVPVWIGVTRDRLSATTVDYDKRGLAQTDGSIELSSSWAPYVQVAWPNRTRLTPYVEAGWVDYDVEFNESEGWSDGGNRFVEVKDSVKGSEYAAGATIRLWKHLSVDFYMRKMSIDDVTGDWYYGRGIRGGDVIFPLSYTAYGFGVVAEF